MPLISLLLITLQCVTRPLFCIEPTLSRVHQTQTISLLQGHSVSKAPPAVIRAEVDSADFEF